MRLLNGIRMLMGFIGFGSAPPAISSPEEPEEDSRRGDDAGIPRTSSSARAATVRYRPPGSIIGRYAWAISLGIHALVLMGAYVAFRHYFRAPAPRVSAVEDRSGGATGSVMQGADATDSVHGGLGVTFLADGPHLNEAAFEGQRLPAFVRGEPRTTQTLINLLSAGGIEPVQDGAIAALSGTPVPPRRHGGAATRPGGPAPIR